MRRNTLKHGLAALALALAGSAFAQPYPSKPVKVIVPYPAGGVVDVVARAVTDRLEQTLRQPFIVVPRPGANANIGAETAARSPADGYTLLMGSPFLATNPLLAKDLRWKTADFVGVGLVGAPPNLFIVTPAVPVNSLRELVAYARQRPGKLNVSNPGVGSSIHLGQELFFSLAGLELVNVSYTGQPQMLPEIMSGAVHFGLVTSALAVPHVNAGRLKALAVSAPQRIRELPDLPTIAEAGFPEAMVLPWYGLVAPAGTPREVVRRLSDELQSALRHPDTVARLEGMGTQITPGSAEEFDALIAHEVERWTRVIRERRIRPE